jgi:hypothetical protein
VRKLLQALRAGINGAETVPSDSARFAGEKIEIKKAAAADGCRLPAASVELRIRAAITT